METETEMMEMDAQSNNSSSEEIAYDEELGSGSEEALDFESEGDSFGAELSWKDLKVTTPDGKKVLLHDACGAVKGRFLAVMGPSGSGKTTLLNLLSCRLNRAKSKGKQMLDGHQYNKHLLKQLSGYVMQDDLLFSSLTVKETLVYAARLRLPVTLSSKAKMQRVNDVITKLGLEKCKNTRVGSPIKRGISGGERKRLCVAIELLMRPKLLFLDEPTSGLDGVTALTLCSLLRNLAHTEKCTVVCTIHQPATQIFNLFDDLMVMKDGQIVYHGPAPDVLNHYEQAGFPCPMHTNPADHILDVISPSSFTIEEIEKANENAQKIIQIYNPPTIDDAKHHVKRKKRHFQIPSRAPWYIQFFWLTQRSFKTVIRGRLIFMAQLLQNIIMAVLIGTAFLQIGDDQASQVRRQPVLFFVCINQGVFGALILINSFPSERIVVLRERAAGTYHVSAYYLGKMVSEMAVQLVFPLVFSCIVYWLIGLQADFGKFVIFTCFMELCSLAATSLALMISTVCRTVTLSVTVLPIILEVCRLFGGFFLSPANLPDYFSWLDALSFVKYAYVGIALNELRGLTLHCEPDEYKNGVCPLTSGEQVIDNLGLDFISIWGCALVLIAMIIFYRFVAYIGLRFIKF